MNIEEWLNHYIWQGVDHFYLINNDSNDDYLAKIQPYIEKRIVTLIHRDEPHAQIKIHNEVVDEYNLRNITKWLLVCDLDEFIFATGADGSQNLREYMERQNNDDIGAIYFSMYMFASRDEFEHPTSIRHGFLWREKRLHQYGKGILKASKINSLDVHFHRIDGGGNFLDNENIHLNHYIIQSKEYFNKVKRTRGDACFEQNTRDDHYFEEHDLREVYDPLLSELLLQSPKKREREEHFTSSESTIEMNEYLILVLFLILMTLIYFCHQF